MKIFILTVCAAAVVLTASAQIPNPPSGFPTQPPSRVEFLTRHLSLSSSQQTEAKTIFDAENAAIKPLMAALQQAQSALTTAAKQGQSDSELDQLAEPVGACLGNIAAVHAKAERQFYAILTPEQQTKYDKLATSASLLPF